MSSKVNIKRTGIKKSSASKTFVKKTKKDKKATGHRKKRLAGFPFPTVMLLTFFYSVGSNMTRKL